MGVVGIDLGTTNTVIATMRDGRVHVLADEEGHRLLPSVVSFHPNGDVLVGRVAKQRRAIDGRNTVASFKRLIGQSWGSDEIEYARQRFPFELREGPERSVVVQARGQEYTLSEISAFVLKRAKQIAENAMGEAVDRAVITVPAHFNELQRTATKVAGRVAGLDVMRILNEPTAAALAYGLGMGGTRERTCVYDFGGGTFDCTVLDLSGEVFEVLSTAGDTFLGGDDVDAAIAEKMADTFLQQHRWDPRTDRQAFERLRLAAERVKIDLTRLPETKIQIREVGYGQGGKALDLTFRMSRPELDAILAPLVDRSFAVTQDALNTAQQAVSSVDRVVLVGGSSRSPFVKMRVEQYFGRPPMDRVNPDEVVAIGAAIQADALADTSRKKNVPPPPLPAAARARAAKGGAGRTHPMGDATMHTIADQDPPSSALSPQSAPSSSRSSQRFGEEPSLGLPMLAGERIDRGAASEDDPSITKMLPTHASEPPPSYPSFGSAQVQTQRSAVPESQRSGTRMPGGEEFGSLPPDAFGSIPPFPGEDEMTNALPAALSASPSTTAPYARVSPKAAGSTAPLPYAPMPPPAPPPGRRNPTGQSSLPPGQFGSLPPDAFGSVPPQVYQPSNPPPEQMRSFVPAPRAAYAAATGFDDGDSLDPNAEAPSPAEFPSSLPPAPFPPQPYGHDLMPAPTQHVASSMPPALPMGSTGVSPVQRAPSYTPPVYQPSAPPPQAPLTPPPQPQSPPVQYQPYVQDSPHIRNRSEAPFQAAPVLVDVTPRALVVETVGGYCDVVLPRNAKIPCERTRKFTTAVDGQTSVRVRVAQGERAQFSRNVLLGEVELTGLRPANRGEVMIAVTFELDPNGSLKVRALDASTGQIAQAVLQLVGVADDEPSIASMVGRLAAIPVSSRMS